LTKLIKFIIAKVLLKFMVSLFGGGGINKNEKIIEEEVEKIDKDIKRLLEEAKRDPFGRGPKNE